MRHDFPALLNNYMLVTRIFNLELLPLRFEKKVLECLSHNHAMLYGLVVLPSKCI